MSVLGFTGSCYPFGIFKLFYIEYLISTKLMTYYFWSPGFFRLFFNIFNLLQISVITVFVLSVKVYNQHIILSKFLQLIGSAIVPSMIIFYLIFVIVCDLEEANMCRFLLVSRWGHINRVNTAMHVPRQGLDRFNPAMHVPRQGLDFHMYIFHCLFKLNILR